MVLRSQIQVLSVSNFFYTRDGNSSEDRPFFLSGCLSVFCTEYTTTGLQESRDPTLTIHKE